MLCSPNGRSHLRYNRQILSRTRLVLDPFHDSSKIDAQCLMLYAPALCSRLYDLCFMLYAQCSMLCALCSMLYALCSMLYADTEEHKHMTAHAHGHQITPTHSHTPMHAHSCSSMPLHANTQKGTSEKLKKMSIFAV
jgi:hypothetical protein